MFKKRFWVVGLSLGLFIGSLTLAPSFNLALTGDDYLGLLRYNGYIKDHGGAPITNFKYFFTDYGPMDMLTALIHNYAGFHHQIYYIVAFILRLLAAVSFIWPVFQITKSRWAAVGAAAFFLITTTGLEATDWSFNMPSYLAIVLLNTLLAVFVVNKTKNALWHWILIAGLFVGAIIVQPLRMLFLPGLMIGLEVHWLVTKFSWKQLILSVIGIGMFVLLSWGLWKFSNYGDAVGARGSLTFSNNYGQIVNHIQNRNYEILLTPFQQLGTLILPNDFLYQRTEVWGLARTMRRVVFPIFVGFGLFLVFFKPSNKILIISFIAAVIWTIFIWKQMMIFASYPLQPFQLLAYLIGGYLLIAVGVWWLKLKDQKIMRLLLVISLLLMGGSLVPPWLRNPGTVFEITGRYLIISGAGLAWLVSLALATKVSPSQKIVLILLFGLFFSLHAKTSYKYLSHLSNVRGIELTDRLRNSVKGSPDMFKPDIPIVYYFEGDNPDILHHAFIFGWPVVAAFRFNFTAPWYRIATTDQWPEVVSAYLDGKALKRFMPGPYKPVKLENIFAYRLENRQLIDISDERRLQLVKIKYDQNRKKQNIR